YLSKILPILLIISASIKITNAQQNLTQTIRGKIVDVDTKSPLLGVNVIVIGSNPFIGASTNINGNFRLDNVPIGRVDLKLTIMGYEEKIMPNLLLRSAKEMVLNVEITESVTQINEVEITAKKHKAETLNEMALTSVRTFSVEETSRYAGSFNDPARMASNFAGVTADAEGDNSIVVRGNSPKGIKWRMEGVEIPNPNHFSDEGATGGPINALNANVLANSEFHTSAFAPEYGNAYSGVLDISLRKGNNEQREYAFSAGVLGLDLTAEGPFASNYEGSYLINYRYSSLGLLDDANIVDFGGIPRYQDAAFKMVLPTNNAGHFTVFGLWGSSNINESYSEIKEGVEKDVFRSTYGAYLGTLGLTHAITLGKKVYVRSAISASKNGSVYHQDVIQDDGTFLTDYKDNLGKKSLRFQSIINYKLNSKNKFKIGGFYTQHYYDLFSEYWRYDKKTWENDFKDKGNAGFAEAFASWKFRPNPLLTLVSGLHYSQFLLNNESIIEPRASLRYQFLPKQFFTLGYGKHSRLESMLTYFAKQQLANGTQITPNQNLNMTKSHHFVMGYENRLTQNVNLKIEAYYQHLFDIPIYNSPSSSYSTINSYDSYTGYKLINEGTGRNYGLELTLERFFSKGYYYLFTGSLYESKYTAKDGIERNTAWNGNYATNLLLGKEWKVGADNKNKSIGFNTKLMLLGGKRFTPILLEKSIEMGGTVRDLANRYSEKGDDIFQANIGLTYRSNRAKTTHEFKIDIQNVTNNQAVINEYFNPYTNKIESGHQLGFIPNIVYKIEF
ncbi:MAG: TonB-dependent receptor, partial [Bacteroidia bacterium]